MKKLSLFLFVFSIANAYSFYINSVNCAVSRTIVNKQSSFPDAKTCSFTLSSPGVATKKFSCVVQPASYGQPSCDADTSTFVSNAPITISAVATQISNYIISPGFPQPTFVYASYCFSTSYPAANCPPSFASVIYVYK